MTGNALCNLMQRGFVVSKWVIVLGVMNVMLFSKSFVKLLRKTGQVWRCQGFKNNKCSVNSASHQKTIL